jgi:hypothetical protein
VTYPQRTRLPDMGLGIGRHGRGEAFDRRVRAVGFARAQYDQHRQVRLVRAAKQST